MIHRIKYCTLLPSNLGCLVCRNFQCLDRLAIMKWELCSLVGQRDHLHSCPIYLSTWSAKHSSHHLNLLYHPTRTSYATSRLNPIYVKAGSPAPVMPCSLFLHLQDQVAVALPVVKYCNSVTHLIHNCSGRSCFCFSTFTSSTSANTVYCLSQAIWIWDLLVFSQQWS